MKKSFILGMALASFSFSSLAQDNGTSFIPSATLDALKAQMAGESMGENDDDTADASALMANPNSGIGNGAPDMSAIQAQSIAAAQKLSNPVDIRQAPEGAADILKQGASALQATNLNQLQGSTQNQWDQGGVPKEFLTSMGSSPFAKNNNSGLIKVVEKPKSDIFLTDISGWNKNTLEQFEKEGRERTEARYKEFLAR